MRTGDFSTEKNSPSKGPGQKGSRSKLFIQAGRYVWDLSKQFEDVTEFQGDFYKRSCIEKADEGTTQ